MKLNVPPTKSSSLSIRRELGFALEGHELLEQKREILVLELMEHVEVAKHVQTDVDELLESAYAELKQAVIRVGSQSLARNAVAAPITTSISLSEHRVMGISAPEIKAEHAPVQPTFGFGGGTIKADDTMAAFSKALEAISRLAQAQNAIFRLARELRKTQRRVNALDKLFIPDYRETLTYITSTLEERDREAFVIMRIIRDRLRRRSQRPDHDPGRRPASGVGD